jgi:hypothetical protein
MQIFEFGNKAAEIVLIQPIMGSDTTPTEKEIARICENSTKDFCLAAFRVNDWNTDLSPWEAPPVFGKDGFGGKAADTLGEIERYCVDPAKTYYIGGYSLAGLFSLWAAYQSDRFCAVAAASPSVWFPGFSEYMEEHPIRCGKVYLSLGDKEEKVKNPVMATVGERIRAACELLKSRDVNCTLEWNEGNHFKDPELRTAKAFAWILEQP